MSNTYDELLSRRQREFRRASLQLTGALVVVAACFFYVGLFDLQRLAEGVPSIFVLLGEMLPPDFGNVADWLAPFLDTLAMSVAGTALAVIFSVLLALLAARNTAPTH